MTTTASSCTKQDVRMKHNTLCIRQHLKTFHSRSQKARLRGGFLKFCQETFVKHIWHKIKSFREFSRVKKTDNLWCVQKSCKFNGCFNSSTLFEERILGGNISITALREWCFVRRGHIMKGSLVSLGYLGNEPLQRQKDCGAAGDFVCRSVGGKLFLYPCCYDLSLEAW